MFLSIATTHSPATDLGFLLHKHPERVHETELGFGKAYVFYPEASETRCEAALVLDVDPVGLVRGRGAGGGLLDQYVNDRPYAASSFLCVAMARALRTAMGGASKDRAELAASAIPLEAVVAPLPARGGPDLVRALFEPLGWSVDAEPIMGAGHTQYVTLRLEGRATLSALLSHLYVLIPVLDDNKHYFVGEDEVAKLLARGEGWLESHPAKGLIVQRYLKHRRTLASEALARLVPETQEEEDATETRASSEDVLERPIRLNDARMDAVIEALRESGARTIADLGSGEGKLLARLLREGWAEKLIGIDASAQALVRAMRRLRDSNHAVDARVTLLHGALTYRDERLAGADAAVLMEVIEHIDADRLPSLERVVFAELRPGTVVVTTPNAEYNALFPNLAPGAMRHPDHRFEWTREQFRAWVRKVEDNHGYRAALRDIGTISDEFGAPTQMAVFSR